MISERMRQAQPVILLGMHRSGTSLATRLLVDLGVHMGTWLSRDAEAVFFQTLNRRIYRSAGADWAAPEPLLQHLDNPVFTSQQAQKLLRSLYDRKMYLGGQPGMRAFFGAARWKEFRENERLPWGWKDPRTTLVFPIWLQVFPRARFVHLVRNGIDVAISTHRRSLKQKRKLRNHILPLDYKPITLDFRYCFRLWETYVSFVLEHKHLIPEEQYLEIRYEDMLQDPMPQLRSLLAFIHHPVEDEVLERVRHRIDTKRLDNSEYAGPYQAYVPECSQSRLMRTFEYS